MEKKEPTTFAQIKLVIFRSLIAFMLIFPILGCWIIFKAITFQQPEYTSKGTIKAEDDYLPVEPLDSKNVKSQEAPPTKPQKHEKKYSVKINDTIDIDIECVNINVDIVPLKDKKNIYVEIKGKGINHPTVQLRESSVLEIMQKDKNTYAPLRTDSAANMAQDIKMAGYRALKGLKGAGKYNITIYVAPENINSLSINALRCNLKIENLICTAIRLSAPIANIKCDNLKSEFTDFFLISGKVILKQFSGNLGCMNMLGSIDVKYPEFKDRIDLFTVFGFAKIKIQKVKDFELLSAPEWALIKNDFKNITSTESKNVICITSFFGYTKIQKI